MGKPTKSEYWMRSSRWILRLARRRPGMWKGNGSAETDDLIQVGWVSLVARGDRSGLLQEMRASDRHWRRGGVVNQNPRPLPGDAVPRQEPTVSEEAARRVEADLNRHRATDRLMRESPLGGSPTSQGRELPGLAAEGWRTVGTPRETAGDYEPTGRPPGRPPMRAPAGASGKLLKAAGIDPFPDGMGELRSLVGAGRSRRDPRLVKAVVECQGWGAAELARLLCCSPQAINAILREHRGV